MSIPDQIDALNSDELLETQTPVLAHTNFGPGLRGKFRAGTSFLAVLTLVLIGIQFIFAMYHPDLNDPDIWWHMRNAQYLFQHHQFPRTDMYSFTLAGHPWISHEWLAEIPYYISYKLFGLVGLKSLTFFMLGAISLLLLYLCVQESGNFKASVTACYFAAFLATISAGPRTILFGYVYLVLLLIVLQRFRRTGSAPLWVIPVLFCLWINSHGSWSIGLIVFFLLAISGVVQGLWGRIVASRWTPSQLRKLIITGIASVAALFVNPFGWHLVYYPFDFASKQKPAIMHIQEWMSLDFQDLRGKMIMGLLFGIILGALIRKRSWDLGQVLVLLFGIYLGLTYVRFMVLLGIVAAPVIAQLLDFFPPYRPEDETPRLNVAVILFMVGFMIYKWPHEAAIKKSVEETYPSGVIGYLQAHPPQGNVLNLYLWGGYVGFHDPEVKDFIDSRVDIFQYVGVFDDYLTLMGADAVQHRPEPILDKYHIRYVLFPPSDSPNPLHAGGELVYVLEHDEHWKEIYKDKVCVLLEKE
jgi:hypothetical protein